MKIPYIIFYSILTTLFSNPLIAQEIEEEYNQVKNTYRSKEFNYIVDEVESPQPVETNSFLMHLYDFLNKMDWKLVLYIIIGIMVLGLLFILFRRGLFVRYPSNSTESDATNFDFIEDHLMEVDLDQPIQEAILAKNYPLAIRYYHYQNTQKLARKGHLVWDKKKTNRQLAYQIINDTIRELYLNNTSIFNQVWFGKFTVDENQFKTLEANFKYLNQSL